MITVGGIEGRVDRLAGLSLGLSREMAAVREANGPLHYLERKAYLSALADAPGGVESDRVALAKAVGRIGQGRAGPRDVPGQA